MASGLPLLDPQAPLSAHEVEQRLGLLQMQPGGRGGGGELTASNGLDLVIYASLQSSASSISTPWRAMASHYGIQEVFRGDNPVVELRKNRNP